jgi:hypothetical protein
MTGTITVKAGDDMRARRPGDVIELTFEWSLDEAPSSVEARLFWFTQGKGTQDIVIIETQPATAAARGDQRFRFRLPEAPYSFSGRLISLTWAVELVADDLAERWEFRLAPDGKEVVLGEAVQDQRLRKLEEYARAR